MASIHVSVYRAYQPNPSMISRAHATITINYSTATPTNPPTTVSVTASSIVVSGVSYTGNGTETPKRVAKAQLETALSSMTATLTFGGQTVASRTGLALGTTYSVSGTKSVNRGTSATTASLVETCDGKTASASISVPALPSWAVTYNGNSGTAVPNAQTKYYGINLPLSGNRPNKADHTFLGWATSTTIASAGTVNYTPSQTYTANAGLNLYAVWERNYQKPTIDNLHVDRCRQNGTLDDDGTYAKVTFEWSVFRTTDARYYGGTSKPYSTNAVGSCTVQVGTRTLTPTLTGVSGTYSAIVGNGSYGVDTSYPVSVSITDTQTAKEDKTTTVEGLLSMAQFPMDINATATAIGFFRPAPNAPEEGAFFAKNVDAPSYSVNGTAIADHVISQLADHVVEQGTDGIWTYRKWNSGVAECWGKYTRNSSLAANSHIGIGGALPSFFIGEAPIATGSGGGTSQPRAFLTYTNVYGTSGAYGIDCYIRNEGGSACSAQWAYFYAIGKWK